MELRLLRTFAAVADLRHFARAADLCNLSQPAVSHQIRLLEEDLGTRLLNRDGRRVSLTVAGELFLEDARRILAAAARARERVQGVSAGTRGRVRIGATPTAALYRLPPVLETYRRTHPQFALHFTIVPELELLERITANDLDMGVIAGRPGPGELRARRIGRDPLVLIAPRTSPLARRRRLKPRDLRDGTWVLREEGSDTRREADAWARRHRVVFPDILVVHGPDAVKRAVGAALGVGFVSACVAAADVSAPIVTLSTSAAMPVRDVWLLDHPHKHHGAACSAMLALLGATPSC